jgi:hypothetical protein
MRTGPRSPGAPESRETRVDIEPGRAELPARQTRPRATPQRHPAHDQVRGKDRADPPPTPPAAHGAPVNAPGDSPSREAVTLLLDLATRRGFTFTPAGEDGALWGERVSARWRDVMFLGASGHANAARTSTGMSVPGEPLFTERVSGSTHLVGYGK